MRRFRVQRLLPAIAVFAAVYLWITGPRAGALMEWILDAGRAAGCHLAQVGPIVWGPDGPFFGDGIKTDLFNFLARHGVWLGGAAGGFAAALATYALCLRLEHVRPLGYRGPTRCGGCGYALSGLREPRCPECGLVI